MIEMNNVEKRFGDFISVNDVSFKVGKGEVCGLVGTNGAGKSTVLSMISGILKADKGDILICGEPVYENTAAKQRIFHLQDKAFYFSNDSLLDTAKFYTSIFKNFDIEKVMKMNEYFGLDPKKSLKKFSKGMQRQASIMLALAANTEILLMDESFDGLDPMNRKTIKKLLVHELSTRELTVIVTSQNLYDLDGLCDNIVLLHKGNKVIGKSVDEAKEAAMKFQVGFNEVPTKQQFDGLNIQNLNIAGRVATFVAIGDVEEVSQQVNRMNPIFEEVLSLSLEEIFVIEVERYVRQRGKKMEFEEVFEVTHHKEVGEV